MIRGLDAASLRSVLYDIMAGERRDLPEASELGGQAADAASDEGARRRAETARAR